MGKKTESTRMKMHPDIEAFYKKRLRDAVDWFSKGSADDFGRLIGYKSGGGSVRQVLNGDRPMQPAILARCKLKPSIEAPGLSTWFRLPPTLELLEAANPDAPQGEEVFTSELMSMIGQLEPDERIKYENSLRAHLGMPPLSLKGNDAAA